MEQVKDTKTNKIETILEKRETSINVTQSKLTEHGINCNQWFTVQDFNKRFKSI